MEKPRKSCVGESDEPIIDVTEFKFQYISVQKMEYVLRIVKRKIEKEKERKLLLDYAQRLPQNTASKVSNGDEMRNTSISNSTEVRTPLHKRNSSRHEDVINRSIKSLAAKVVNRGYKLNGPSINKHQKSVSEHGHLQTTAISSINIKTPKDVTILNKKIDSSQRFGFVLNESHRRPQPVKKSTSGLGGKQLNISSMLNKPSPKEHKPLNYDRELLKKEDKAINFNSIAFQHLCSEMWQKLDIMEKNEDKFRQHVKAGLGNNHANGIQSVTKAISRLRNETNVQPNIEQPTKISSITVTRAKAFQLYDADTNCTLIARLSNSIVEDLLNQLCLELNDLPDLFLSELFDKEFEQSSSKL